MSYHIAYLNIPAYGHVLPTLPVVRELLRRGHRVTYVTSRELVDVVAETGADVLPYETSLGEYPNQLRDLGDDAIAWWPHTYLQESLNLLPAITEHFTADTPDLVAHDVLLNAAGRVLGQDLGRPVLQSTPIFASNQRFDLLSEMYAHRGIAKDHPGRTALAKLATDFLRSRNRPPADIGWLTDWAAEDEVVFLSRDFQPHGETFGERHAFVGLCTADLGDTAPPAKPEVYISMGTLAVPSADFYDICVRAFENTAWQVAFVFGNRPPVVDPATLPPNISVLGWVPQLAMLEHAKVFVSHGGMGGLQQALAQDTPLIVIASHPEPEITSRHVGRIGAGAGLSPAGLTPELLLSTVERVTSDPAVLRRVRELSTDIRGAGGAIRAADVIEAKVRTTAPDFLETR